MSNETIYAPVISSEVIEASMRKARIERSKAVWDILQKLFSRPEATDVTADDVLASKGRLRLG
jgi:hypothetical protein